MEMPIRHANAILEMERVFWGTGQDFVSKDMLPGVTQIPTVDVKYNTGAAKYPCGFEIKSLTLQSVLIRE
jgi:hypothetical protein